MKTVLSRIVGIGVFCLLAAQSAAAGDVSSQLRRLNQDFSVFSDKFYAVRVSGGKRVLVQRNTFRDAKGRVLREVTRPVFLYLTAFQARSLKSAGWKVFFSRPDRLSLVAYPFYVRENCTDGELTKAIDLASRKKLPISPDPAFQAKMGIKEILDLDQRIEQNDQTRRCKIVLMHRLDLSFCPENFRNAYKKHRKAWADYRKIEEAVVMEYLLDGDVGTVSETQVAMRRKKIETSFAEVLRIARSYGVDTSSYY